MFRYLGATCELDSLLISSGLTVGVFPDASTSSFARSMSENFTVCKMGEVGSLKNNCTYLGLDFNSGEATP